MGEQQMEKVEMRIFLVTVSSAGKDPYPDLEKPIIASLTKYVAEVKVVPYADPSLLHEIREFNPDVVLVFCGLFLDRSSISIIRNWGFKLAVWFIDDPYYFDWSRELSLLYDYVFTQDRDCVSLYRNYGCSRVFHLPLASDLEVYRPVTVGSHYQSDICFIGSAFSNRLDFIAQISEYLKTKNVLILGQWWERLPTCSVLKEMVRPLDWISAKDVCHYYNGAKIVFNLHRTEYTDGFNQNHTGVKASSVNNRIFDIASTCSFLMTDWRSDLEQYFIPGEEIETFQDTKEFIEKCEFYLENKDIRENIARKGYERTTKENTFDIRIKKMLEAIVSS